MSEMFRSAGIPIKILEGPSRVTNMNGMFRSASSFNGDLGSWVTKRHRYGRMFYYATSFNQISEVGTHQMLQR